MNLVTCGKDCIHQFDGYCKLEQHFFVSQYKVDGCCYYQKRKKPAKKIDPEKSRWY